MKLTLNENEITAFVVQGLAAQGINIETTDVVYTKGRGNNDSVTAEFDASFLGATTAAAPKSTAAPVVEEAPEEATAPTKRKLLGKKAVVAEESTDEPEDTTETTEEEVGEPVDTTVEEAGAEDESSEPVDEPVEEVDDVPSTKPAGKKRVFGNRNR